MQRTNFVSMLLVLVIGVGAAIGLANAFPDETTEKIADQFLCDGPANAIDSEGGIVPKVICIEHRASGAVRPDRQGGNLIEDLNSSDNVTGFATGIFAFFCVAVLALITNLIARWLRPARVPRRRAGPVHA